MRRPLAVLSLAAAAVLACHAAPTPAPGATPANWAMITRDEIDSSKTNNVYELLTKLRAGYLRDRGKVSILSKTNDKAVVFLNDAEYGILETLRNMPTNRIEEVYYFSGAEAVAKFGARYGGGVVQVISRYN